MDDRRQTIDDRSVVRSGPSSIVPRLSSGAWPWLLAGVIALLALALRLWTIRQSLPYVNHPDEPNPVNYVVQMLRTGDLNPHAFQKPSLYVYLLLAVVAVDYRWGLATGLYAPLDQMTVTTYLYTTVPGFFMAGRALTAVIGSLSVLAVFALGKRLWSVGAGLVAALVLATLPFHISHSQYVTTDVTSAFLVLLAFGAAVWVAQTGRWRAYLLAGLLAGLAASTKYNAGVAALMVVAAHGLYWRGQALRQLPRMVGAGAAAVGGFVLGTPFALLSWQEFWLGLTGQMGDYSAGQHGDFTGAWNWRGYFNFFWHEGLQPSGMITMLVGVAVLLRRRARVGVVWLSFIVPYMLLHMAQSSHFIRNMVPVGVLATLPIGVAVAAVGARTAQRAPRLRAVVVVIMLAALLVPAAVDTMRAQARQARGDTRVQMSSWIAAHVPPGAQIAAELMPLPGPLESRWTTVEALPDHPFAWYRQQGYAFVIASSDAWHQWDMPDRYRAWATTEPVAEFGGATAQHMLGPHLAVFQTGLSPADVPEPLADDVEFGGTRLLGFAIGQPLPDAPRIGLKPAHTFKPGDVLGLRTFWQVQQPFSEDYFIYVHLLNAQGDTVAQRDAPPWQGRFPTSTWQPGSMVADVNDVPLPASLPPGDYTLEIGMFNPLTNARPPLTVNGQAPEGALHAGTIHVK
jgi:4-amino-4-deoxy-L-arabinose transferase-like glycosyltransferase